MPAILRTLIIASALAVTALAQTRAPQPTEADFTLHNYKFKSGETLPDLKLHYLTLGTPHKNAAGQIDNAVLLLHGTGGNGRGFLTASFARELFGPGQPLDTARYYLILPDDIGHGRSSKPSDGLHMRFPKYDYDDMVATQKLTLESLGVNHLRLILGTSMGCMQTFTWGTTYPTFADNLVPMACLPVEVAGRNRMIRYLSMQLIRTDPAWNNGEYTTQPPSLKLVGEIGVLTSVPLQMQKNYPTRAQADAYIDKMMSQPAGGDANDYLYQMDASRNYNPAARLKDITAHVLWINSADDHTNPQELGIAQQKVKEIPHGQFVLIPISDETRGHSTFMVAKLWQQQLANLLAQH